MLYYKHRKSFSIFLVLFFLGLVTCTDFNSSFTPNHIEHLRSETKLLFQHAWSSYMNHGFPYDEVRPLTCEPYGPDYQDKYNIIRNDAMGNISSTLLDNLDTLIIMEEWNELEMALAYLKKEKDRIFVQDTIVQVFETTIRSLGGLLSCHLLLTDITNNNIIPKNYVRFKSISDNYDGFLLKMAHDLGSRLIPAFKTTTNIPVPRINLAKGVKVVPSSLQIENCLAGATSPVLEFTLLSKLTGDPQFEHYSQITFWKLWSSKSLTNLLPMTINPIKNQWLDSITGIGASVDSFYEYSAKSAILFNDSYMWTVFKTSYKALLTHSAQGGGMLEGSMLFSNVRVNDGFMFSDWIDSLGAFWSGLQVLTGQLSDAVKTHLIYLKIWDKFDSIPERWKFFTSGPPQSFKEVLSLEWYPLRPEFIESTYYLFRATRDPMYLQIGERVLNLFKTRFKAKCGFGGFQDVTTGKLQNRMETFVMGETLKYLYLLFDVNDEVFLHTHLMTNKNWVFSTEAHPLWFNKKLDPVNKLKFNDDEAVKDKYPWLTSFLSLVDRINNNKRLLTTGPHSSYYRNTTLPGVEMIDVPGADNFEHLEKIDPFHNRFDKCEISPFKPKPKEFMMSSYYAWDQLFNADYLFQNSLKRPSYLPQTSLDGSCIELTKPFFEKFSLFVPQPNDLHLQCTRLPTTVSYEMFLGNMEEIEKTEVSLLSVKTKPDQVSALMDGDIWIPILASLRLRFEILRVGSIDISNKIITEDYLAEFFNTNPYSTHLDPSQRKEVLRLSKVNGIYVESGQVVWTLPFTTIDQEIGEVPLLAHSEDGKIYMNGIVIENVMVYYG